MQCSLTGFNGQHSDPLSGHYHLGNGYRAYNPLLGRFTAPDNWSPFGSGGINPYAYCAGDPVNRADPSGHFSLGQGIGMALGFVAGITLSIVTEGASMPAVLSLIATVAGDALIGVGTELATEAIDGQWTNWNQVGMAAGLSVVASLAGFSLGRLSKLKGTSSRPFGGLMVEGDNTRVSRFYRVDISPPSVITQIGFRGNNTRRILKLYRHNTIFAATTLEGIDAFRAEISSVSRNEFGAARSYYFRYVNINGYLEERPKPLYLYEITLPDSHPHEILSEFFRDENNIEHAFRATSRAEALVPEMYDYNFVQFRESLQRYATAYTLTTEVQIKGPVFPENIRYIPSQDELFMRGPIALVHG